FRRRIFRDHSDRSAASGVSAELRAGDLPETHAAANRAAVDMASFDRVPISMGFVRRIKSGHAFGFASSYSFFVTRSRGSVTVSFGKHPIAWGNDNPLSKANAPSQRSIQRERESQP